MTKNRKSPQEKKQLEYANDHFTFAWYSAHGFRKTWKLKKTRANREYRSKAEQLLAQAKPGTKAEDVELITEDLTATRLHKKSLVRKVLYKGGTVTVGEKVQQKLEKRTDLVGRRVQRRKQIADEAASAIATLRSLDGDRLVDVVRRASLLCSSKNVGKGTHMRRSSDPVDRALSFLYEVISGMSSGPISPREFLCKNPALEKELSTWIEKANRILARDRRTMEQKVNQQQAVNKKKRTVRNSFPKPNSG